MEALTRHLDAFTAFVRSRTGDPELAADLVQECLLKALRTENAPQDEEGAVTWFYRVLRNAIIDAHRRHGTREQALDQLEFELPLQATPEDERDVCQCVLRLLPGLPAGDAALLRAVDLEGGSVTEMARTAGQRVNTLNVKLLRARRKLKQELEKVCRACATHGCLDCDCAPPAPQPPGGRPA